MSDQLLDRRFGYALLLELVDKREAKPMGACLASWPTVYPQLRIIRNFRWMQLASGSALDVYLENRDELLKLAKRIVRDGASAEDVVQEAWFRFSSRSVDTEIAQPKHYLFTIVRNLALDWLRRSAVRPAIPTAQAYIDAVASEAPSAERVLSARDEVRQLHTVLKELPERTQLAFRLNRVERRTLQETAERLGISVVMVHRIVTQASVYLAQRIYGEDEE